MKNNTLEIIRDSAQKISVYCVYLGYFLLALTRKVKILLYYNGK